MTWRETITLLFGSAAALHTGDAPAAAAPTGADVAADQPAIDRDLWVYSDPAARQRLLLLAGHRSHSSHSSHSSHRSHYSGSSGHSSHYSGSTYTPPAPVYTPTPARKPTPPPTSASPKRPASGGRVGAGSPIVIPDAPAQPQGLLDSSNAPPTPTTRPTRTETRDFVQRMQIALIILGYDPGAADGTLGAQTKDALRKFQAASGLPATGYMDVATLRALGVLP